MSLEQLKAFLAKVKGDFSLQEKLKAANTPEEIVAIAKDSGFTISTDDMNNAQSEISEEELEGAAGGTLTPGVALVFTGVSLVAGEGFACYRNSSKCKWRGNSFNY